MNCLICGGKANLKNNLYDDRHGYPKMFSLFECSTCQHKYIEHEFSSSDVEELYTNYYPRTQLSITDYTPLSYKQNFKSWLNGAKCSAFTYIPKKVRVLDIGCGFGESLGYHKERGCDVYGVEADSNIRKVIKKHGFNIKVGLFDDTDYEENFFDFVTMDQVLEHITNPVEILRGISKILQKNGKLVLTVPNSNGWGAKFFGKKWINWHTPYHLQHFSKTSLHLLAEKTNFDMVSFKTITSSEWLNYQWISLISTPKQGEKSFFWSPLQHKSVMIKVTIAILTILHKTKINHIITRIFDLLSYGDNYVVILKRR